MAVAEGDSLLVLIRGSSALESLPPLDLLSAEVGTRCCTMVLLTTYLKVGVCEPEGVDSEMTARRIEFCQSERAIEVSALYNVDTKERGASMNARRTREGSKKGNVR